MEVYIAPVIYCITIVGGKRPVSHLGHITHRGMAPGTYSRLGRPQSHSGSFGVEIYLALFGFDTQFLSHLVHCLVSSVTELSLLPFEFIMSVKYPPGNVNVEDVSVVCTFTTSDAHLQ